MQCVPGRCQCWHLVVVGVWHSSPTKGERIHQRIDKRFIEAACIADLDVCRPNYVSLDTRKRSLKDKSQKTRRQSKPDKEWSLQRTGTRVRATQSVSKVGLCQDPVVCVELMTH